jgi:leucyl aminopeptidase
MKTIKPLNLEIIETDLDCLSTNEGILIVLITPEGVMDPAARRVNKLTRGSLSRLISSKKFKDADIGHLFPINFPDRCAAEQICVLKIGRRSSKTTARKAGVAIAKMKGSVEILLALGNFPQFN